MSEPTDLSSLPKDELLARLEKCYADYKPVNDQVADIADQVNLIGREIYRRLLAKALPGLPVGSGRLVASIGCNVNPSKGGPQLLARIEQLAQQDIKVVRIEFEESLCEYRLYGEVSK